MALFVSSSKDFNMKSSLKILTILYFLMIYPLAYAQDNLDLFPIQGKDSISKETFDEVKQLILENYYSQNLNESDLYYAAIMGMLRHISPPDNPELARYWSKEEYEKILNSLKGESVSLGIKSSFNANDGSLTVTEIQSRGPAAGVLKVYDRILEINDETLLGKSLQQVNDLLEGPENSSVKLTVNRGTEIIKLKIIRTRFSVDNLRANLIMNSVAFIELDKVYAGAAYDVKNSLDSLMELGATKLILDFRNNTGGVLNEGIQIANLFLEDRNIIMRNYDRKMSNPTPIVATSENTYNLPCVVLINQNTASASEIVVSALQEHKKATIIGNKTYGKGVIETTYELNSGSRVKFITASMYSPSGKSWQSNGILPDFLVNQSDNDYNSLSKLPVNQRVNRDIYLITATKLLNQ